MGVTINGDKTNEENFIIRFKTWFDKDHMNHFSRVNGATSKARANQLISFGKSTHNPEALYFCGVLYERGFGLKKNISIAFKYYKRSASFGWTPAMERVGLFYKNGIATIMNPEKSFEWYKKAADSGSIIGLKRLSAFYLEGYGVERNEKMSIHYKTLSHSASELERILNNETSTTSNGDGKLKKRLSWTQALESNKPKMERSVSVGNMGKGVENMKRTNRPGSENDIRRKFKLILPDEPKEYKKEKKVEKKTETENIIEEIDVIKENKENKVVSKKKNISKSLLDSFNRPNTLQRTVSLNVLRDKNAGMTKKELMDIRRKKRSNSVIKDADGIIERSHAMVIGDLELKVKILNEENERIKQLLEEERMTHIRTQNSLRNLQREHYSLKRKYLKLTKQNL